MRYEIVCELGANAYKIIAFDGNVTAGYLTGYINHRAHTVKCYPNKILTASLSRVDFPVTLTLGGIPWSKPVKEDKLCAN